MNNSVSYEDYSNECYKQKCLVQGYGLALENLAAFKADPEFGDGYIDANKLDARIAYIMNVYVKEINNLKMAYDILKEMKGIQSISRSEIERKKKSVITYHERALLKYVSESFNRAVEYYKSPDAHLPEVRVFAHYCSNYINYEYGI